MATAAARLLPLPTHPQAVRPVPTLPIRRPGEEYLCRWVQSLYLDAQAARDRLVKHRFWQTWEQGYHGDYWPEVLPSYKSPVNINEMKRLILTELSDLTDNSPTVYVANRLRKEGGRVEAMEEAIHAFWVRESVDLKLLEACVDAAVWPCGFLELVWDPLKENGQGDLDVRVRHPATVFPDPYATNDEDWRYVILADPMDVHEVWQKWPDQGKRVRPDSRRPGDSSPLTGPAALAGRGNNLITPLYPVTAPVPTSGIDQRVLVYTCYTKDSTTEVDMVPVRQPSGLVQLQRRTRYKYPYGRLIQCTQDVVLYDGPNPYESGFPLVRIVLQPSLHRFWCERSMVGDLLELQRASDKLESLTVENALRMQKAVIVADANSGIRQQNFGDIPGQIVYVTPGSTVRWERPQPLPPDLVQHGQRLRDVMGRLMGHTPSRAGMAGRGNISADLNETEISQAQGLTRLRARYLHNSVTRFVMKIFSGMAEFYRGPRILPRVLHEEWAPVEWQPVNNPREYAVMVDPNSFTIQSKTMVKRLAVALAKLQKIDDETLLTILEFPKAQEIARKTQQQLLLQAQAKQGQRQQRKK